MSKSPKLFRKFLQVFGLYIREIIGWALMGWGLYIFRNECLMRYLRLGLVIEGLITAIIGYVIFRGGLQLVKVSVAARSVRASLPTSDQQSSARVGERNTTQMSTVS